MVGYQILLTVCSILSGAGCREEIIPVLDQASAALPYTCMISGQFEIVKYMEGRPNFYVSRWRCERAGQTANL